MNCDSAARGLMCAATLVALLVGDAAVVAADANGIALCTAAGDQLSPVIVPDGAGGVIVSWHDHRPTAAAGGVTYAQRVNASGSPQWAANGVALSTTGDPGDPLAPAIASDGAGGAFVAYGGSNAPPRAQWVNAAGVPQWGADGVPLSLSATVRHLAIARDVGGGGGAIVAWREDNGTGGLSDLYAQRVNAAGAIQWGPTGVAVTTTNMNNETHPALISDGAGGVFITWYNGTSGVRLRRLNAAGGNLWPNTPLSNISNNNPPAIVSDGAGGVVVAWTGPGIFAQRVNDSGDKQWDPPGDGVTLATTGNLLAAIGDGAGGATVAWQDSRSGTNYNIYAQRVNGAGAPQWTMNGVEVCFETDDQQSPTIVSDGGTGAIISWHDRRSGASGADIYAQRIDAAGASQWTPNGEPLCTAANDQEFPTSASDGAGGAFVVWQDRRSGTNYDIYLHRINPAGLALSAPGSGASLAARVWPDPFSDRVQMAFVLPEAASVRMEVFDVGGRSVRGFGTSHLAAGPHVLTWDGRTNDGRRAGDGIYFLRVVGGGFALSRSVVRLQ